MDISIFLAKLIGLFSIVISLGILFNLRNYQKVMEDFIENAALIYLSGIFAFLFGLLVVLFHNVWVMRWPVIITIFGWSGIIKGFWLISLPNTVSKYMQVYLKKTVLLEIHLAVFLALGVIVTFFGYFPG